MDSRWHGCSFRRFAGLPFWHQPSTNELQISTFERTTIVDDQTQVFTLEQWLDLTKSTNPVSVADHIRMNWEDHGIEHKLKSTITRDRTGIELYYESTKVYYIEVYYI